MMKITESAVISAMKKNTSLCKILDKQINVLFITRGILALWGRALWKQEDLSSNPSAHVTSWVWLNIPVTPTLEGRQGPRVLCQKTRLQRQASGLVKAQAKGSKAESRGEKTPGISLASIGAQTDADMQLSLHQTHTNNTHGKNNFLYWI